MPIAYAQPSTFYHNGFLPNSKATQVVVKFPGEYYGTSTKSYGGPEMDKVKVIFGLISDKQGKEKFAVEVDRLGLFGLPVQKTVFTYYDANSNVAITTSKKMPHTLNLAWQANEKIANMPPASEELIDQYKVAGLDIARIQNTLFQFGLFNEGIAPKLTQQMLMAFAFAEPKELNP